MRRSARRSDTVSCVRKQGLGADRKASPVFVVAVATKAAMGRVVNVAKVERRRGVRPVQQPGQGVHHGRSRAAALDRVPPQRGRDCSDMTRGGRLFRSIRVALVPGVVLGVALAASGTTPGVASAQADTTEGSVPCAQVDHGFRPTSLAIDGVVGSTRVLALGQDQHGVPRPPPLTERGKWQFAWDKASGVRPGGPRRCRAPHRAHLPARRVPRAGTGQPAARPLAHRRPARGLGRRW